jgi:predicted adenylyl cyclase CyaB
MKKNNVETEIRSFITLLQYKRLTSFFKKSAKFLSLENQETHYFSGSQDLRIQRTDDTAKLWLKGGKLHQKSREDIVVRCQKDDFENLETLLSRLGYNPEIKWFRKRNNFLWKGITVSLDYTKGYGYIIELEKMGDEKSAQNDYRILLAKMAELGVELTPKAEFDKKFAYYKKNWRKLI